ncbi:MAG: molecular chaperone DnaJ, partial [Pseudomonadota bacterium]
MAPRNGKSPFDFDISVSADKKRRARARGMSGAVESSSRSCEHPGCDKAGKYRAPKSPDNLEEFHWFCLEHVRAYNLKWNFFENHSEAELERQFAADKVWERPTRPFKTAEGHPEGRAWQRFGFDDPLEVLGEKGTKKGNGTSVSQRRLPATERKA